MKLPIEHKYFMQVKKGEKTIDYRAGHITFIDKKTGRKCIRNVVGVKFIPRSEVPKELNKDVLFGDDKWIIAFELEPEGKVVVRGDKLNQDLLL